MAEIKKMERLIKIIPRTILFRCSLFIIGFFIENYLLESEDIYNRK